MKISLPLEIYYTNTKKMRLNLNTYRNAHYFTLNAVKVEFGVLAVPLLKNIEPLASPIELTYTLFPKRKCDVNNVCCVVDKFFLDVLVKQNLIPDDNCEIVTKTTFKFGGYDKNQERVEVEIDGVV